MHLGDHCKRLEHVNLIGCSSMTSHGLVDFVRQSVHLEALLLDGSIDLIDSSLDKLATYCGQMTSIGLRRCHSISFDAILRFVRSCKRLEHFDLIDTKACAEANVRRLFAEGRALQHVYLPGAYSRWEMERVEETTAPANAHTATSS